MNIIRKILCKLKFHDEELSQIEIRPVFWDRWNKKEIMLPTCPGWLYTCKHCKKERTEAI